MKLAKQGSGSEWKLSGLPEPRLPSPQARNEEYRIQNEERGEDRDSLE